MAFAEYPKALYLDGWHNLASYRRVASAEEEGAARAEGYKTLPEWPHPDNPPVAEPVVVAAPEAPPAAPNPEPAPRRPGRPRKA